MPELFFIIFLACSPTGECQKVINLEHVYVNIDNCNRDAQLLRSIKDPRIHKLHCVKYIAYAEKV